MSSWLKYSYSYSAMVVLVASSNYLVQFPINDWLTWGAFTYPATFLVTELNNRFYGPARARNIVYIGFACALLVSFLLATPRIAIASGLAFLVSQLLDISIFNRLRQKTWWQAPFFASCGASIIDTFLFFILAFWGEPIALFSLATGDCLVKIGVDLAMLTPFRFIIQRQLGPNTLDLNQAV